MFSAGSLPQKRMLLGCRKNFEGYDNWLSSWTAVGYDFRSGAVFMDRNMKVCLFIPDEDGNYFAGKLFDNLADLGDFVEELMAFSTLYNEQQGSNNAMLIQELKKIEDGKCLLLQNNIQKVISDLSGN